MEVISVFSESLFNTLLLSFVIYGAWLLIYSPKATAFEKSDLILDELNGQFCQLMCLLEDAPSSALKGQSYHLATPLMTPFACIFVQGWQDFYQQNLAKPSINYWQWEDKPESHNICPELTLLFYLEKPQGYSQEILESLAENQPLFSPSKGKFSHLDLPVQTNMRLALQAWHNQALKLVGEDALTHIYQVCYKTQWSTINHIINFTRDAIPKESQSWWKILGVKSSADALGVETAYKKLLRQWHPDINKHPLANEMTCRINLAYEQYKKVTTTATTPASTVKSNQLMTLYLQLWVKVLLGWLKPLLTR